MIKRRLRNKNSHVVLEGFLSVLIDRQIKITQILESEGNQDDDEQKFNRVDLLVEDEKQEKFLIEVQSDHELDFFHRMAFGASKIISDYMKIDFRTRRIRYFKALIAPMRKHFSLATYKIPTNFITFAA